MVSDIVLLRKLHNFVKDSIEACVGCISGAIMLDVPIEKRKADSYIRGEKEK